MSTIIEYRKIFGEQFRSLLTFPRSLEFIGVVFFLIGISLGIISEIGYEPACALIGCVVIFLSYLFFQKQFRIACTFSILYSIVGIIVPLLNFRGHSITEWGTYVAILLLMLSMSALKITWKNKQFFSAIENWRKFIKQSFVTFIPPCIFLVGTIYVRMKRIDINTPHTLVFDIIYWLLLCMPITLPLMDNFKFNEKKLDQSVLGFNEKLHINQNQSASKSDELTNLIDQI